MVDSDINALLDELISCWSNWETRRRFYLETLAPAIVGDDCSVANLTSNERRLVDRLRGLLTETQWRDLPLLLDHRETFLREDRLRRREAARLRATREREERERRRAEQKELERQHAEELRRRQRDLDASRQRKQALLARISNTLESDFLTTGDVYRLDADRALVSQSEYETMRTAFVKEWVRREADLTLDDEQAAAVAAVDGDVRVTARAGSGKTRTLVARAAFLIRHCRVDCRTILLLAFNRQAAQELRERLEIPLKGDLPHIMTFHALAYALVHPEEALVFDDPGADSLALSRSIQDVIDEHIASEEFGETVQRIMLEHFRSDWEEIVAGGFNVGMEEFLSRRRALARETLGGEFVKSHGEKLIANTLFEHGVTYGYERNRRWNGENYRPDFTIVFANGGGVVIEYFGLLGDPDYDEQAEKKRSYWRTQANWTLLEYSPRDVGGDPAAFAARLIADLGECGVRGERLLEEAIWELIRNRAIDRFTGAVRTFVARCRKRRLSPEQLAQLIDGHVTLTAAEGAFLRVGQSIYRGYLSKLAETDQEDFDGLMWRAIEMLQSGLTRFSRNKGVERGDLADLRFVLIDEFQDFSQMFFEMICGIRSAARKAELFCVGDDWQAINSFAGSDLCYFLSFNKYFEGGASREIRTNYRSPVKVVMAGNAVMAGRGSPAVAHRSDQGTVWVCDLNDLPATEIERERHRGDEITPAVLRLVQYFISQDQDVVMLSRQHRIPWYVARSGERERIPDPLERFLRQVRSYLPEEDRNRVSISTTHKYKGLEQSAVIVLDATEGSYPLVHPSWVFLRLFGDTLAKIEEEERRLFYVAVTRAASALCLVAEARRYSPYLQDIERTCGLRAVPWAQLPPAPALDGPRVEICVFDAFEVKDELRRLGFRWNPKGKYWSRTYPADSYSEAKLLTKTWYRGGVQVEVRSDQDRVIRPRSAQQTVSGREVVLRSIADTDA